MRQTRIVGLLVVMAMLAVACAGDGGETTTTSDEAPATTEAQPTTTEAMADTTTTAAGDTTTTAGGGGDDLSAYGESTDADAALVEKALGPVGEVPDVVLASIARAGQELDQATIDKALECWNAVECETGSGGELVMGYADGGGLNVWRQVTRMEAILQALTYPEIGTMVFRDAQWSEDPAVPAGDIRFLIERGVDFMIGYPDWGVALADAVLETEAAGIPYIPYSAGYVGLPGTEGALVPGEDYTAIVGEDLCALGESFAEIINTEVGEGPVGILGGTPGNALSAGWQQCQMAALNDSIEVMGPADTFWVNSIALEVVTGWLSTTPDIGGYSYEYADGMYTALDAYSQLGVELDDMVMTMRTDEQTLFCDPRFLDNSDYRIWFSAGGNFQSRTAVTAAMLHLQGYELPGHIVVPHTMREAGPDDCNPDRVTPTVSNTSLVPDDVLALMYPEG